MVMNYNFPISETAIVLKTICIYLYYTLNIDNTDSITTIKNDSSQSPKCHLFIAQDKVLCTGISEIKYAVIKIDCNNLNNKNTGNNIFTYET